jgi:hypothetical protein
MITANRGSPASAPVIRLFLVVEGASFAVAAAVHFGVLVHGYEHPFAPYAESAIALVLLVGLVLTGIGPGLTRAIGLAVQAFALLGTLVGLFTIAVGVGPRTVPDLVYHVAIAIVLGWGLLVTARA